MVNPSTTKRRAAAHAAHPLGQRTDAAVPPTGDVSASATGDVSASPTGLGPPVLMLGLGWFPDSVGGLDRYFRALFEHLPEASGVVLAPAPTAPEGIAVTAPGEAKLARRLLSFHLAARRASADHELVDAHFALYAAAPLLFGALRMRPAVFHFHGPWAQENAAAGDRSRGRLALRSLLERRVLRRAQAHVVLSGAFRRLLVERYRVPPWNVHVIAPGVDLDAFTPGERELARARLGIDPAAFVAVCARRLVARMGVETLLDAWVELAPDLPDGAQLLVVGDGPLGAGLRARCAQPPLAGRVRMTGRVAESELLDAYRSADVAVVPTVAVEGFGLVVLEAAACGTPSIVSDVGGLPEAVGGLDRSLVVPAGDGAALGERLLAAARGELPSRAATRRYAERFRWPAVAERHRALYRRVSRGERDDRLRVVYLDHVARLSGGEIALLRLLPHLREVNAHVILGEDGPFAARLQQAGVSVEVLPIDPAARELRKDRVVASRAASRATLGAGLYVLRLARRLRTLQPDAVHVNSLKAGVYGVPAAKLAGVPAIWHVRDRIAEDYLPRPAIRLVRAMSAHLPAGVIANSTATLQTLRAGGAKVQHQVIPDSALPPAGSTTRPVAGSARTPAGVAAADGRPKPQPTTFGMVGRLAPWKGQDLFLRAFAAAFPHGDARAVVVGSALFGEDDYARGLPRLVAELGLTGRVELRGFREDVWRELASFDVLVHASVTPEPFGQVVIEGMAAGLPVIAADEGGPAAAIRDGETGRLFKSRDAGSLGAAMLALAEDADARRRLGAAARVAAERYHPDVIARELQQFYERVAPRGDARRG